jgi:hypothetical protein
MRSGGESIQHSIHTGERLRTRPPGARIFIVIHIILSVLPVFGMDPHHGKWFSAVPFLALFPLTLAYVLIVQGAMDVRILLRIGTKFLFGMASLRASLRGLILDSPD